MFNFGKNSLEKINTLDDRLTRVLYRAIEFYNFSVVCGQRDEKAQNEAFRLGMSKLKFPESKHNSSPSKAFDIYPWHAMYRSLTEDLAVLDRIKSMSGCTVEQARVFVREEYCMMAQAIKIAAQLEGIKLRWGGDWDGDTDRLDQTFHDLAHFELTD